jgi:hypothetical protein
MPKKTITPSQEQGTETPGKLSPKQQKILKDFLNLAYEVNLIQAPDNKRFTEFQRSLNL